MCHSFDATAASIVLSLQRVLTLGWSWGWKDLFTAAVVILRLRTSLCTHKGAQRQAGEPKFWTQSISNPVQPLLGLSWGSGPVVQMSCSSWRVNWNGSSDHLSDWEWALPSGMEAFQGHTRISKCLGVKAKLRKGMDLGDFGRNKHGKIKGYGCIKGQPHVSNGRSVCLWPCPALNQHSLHCLLTEVHFWLFWGTHCLVCVCMTAAAGVGAWVWGTWLCLRVCKWVHTQQNELARRCGGLGCVSWAWDHSRSCLWEGL